ncbi:MAG TPA: hypothetical protein VK879_09380 [Candidatus Sulfomarinibacteraceae bacterium]|nr:hypothetical protein [Candidatus Sulfomarinibacteraceae bacterium]
MRSKLGHWCDGVIEAAILVAVIGAPLFFNIHSDRVFEPDKLTLVRSMALLMSAAWLVGFIDRQGWRHLSWLRRDHDESIWRMPFILPVTLLVIIYLISTAFSVVPRISWAGSYQRLQGTYSTLSYIIIFVLAAATFRRREQINRLVTTVIITSIPISLYGLLQHYGLDPLPWGGNVQRRIAGHMGNAIFIAAYLIMAVPLTAARIIDAFTNILGDEQLSYADVIRSSVYIFTLSIQLVAIYWSGSRGPLLGLIVGMFALVLILLVSLRNAVTEEGRFGMPDALKASGLVIGGLLLSLGLLYLLLSAANLSPAATTFAAAVGAAGLVSIIIFVMIAARNVWRWLWLSWLLLTAIVALGLGLFNLPQEVTEPVQDTPVMGSLLDTMEEWRELPTVGRFGRMLDAEQETGRVRVLIWEGALELIQPHDPLVYPDGEEDSFNFLRPLIGYGPESMYVAYNRFYVPELATVEARNASPDRSHNETFDALIITGLIGFLVWQALYVSVFYYGFRWLGVVRSPRDRNILIALWVGGAALAALLLTQWLGAVYIGVAIPFGSIGGLILYLVYYALVASTGEAAAEATSDPFQVDRLLMMGLLAAVLAHYVEIHFGIAIAATRVHFFVYIALMFLVGYLLPRYREEDVLPDEEAVPAKRGRRRRRRRFGSTAPGWFSPVFAATFVLAVIIGILGYDFMNYVHPQGLQVQTLADVPSAGAILHQAFFVNPDQNFANSPFIFLVITLSWMLGTLASISEMSRLDIIKVSNVTTSSRFQTSRLRYAASLFIVMVIAGLALRFIQPSGEVVSTTRVLGQGLLLVWSAACLFAAFRLIQEHDAGRRTGGVVAAAGLAFSLPALIAGAGFYGLVMLLASALILYLLWDSNWNGYILPALLMASISLAVGFAYAYVQANQIRSAVFFGPPQPMPELDRLIFSSGKFTQFLTAFYAFIVVMVLLGSIAISRNRVLRARTAVGASWALLSLVVLFSAALYLVDRTNMNIIQADIVYKQARPLDNQASRAGEAAAWDAPIAIYEYAIELAPLEDFYYLFLGRAYLEKSAVTQNPEEQRQLLETARQRLRLAQEINPLNTDHTANLARLTTRWASLSNLDPGQRAELVEEAKSLYRDALALSPQNSVIRNEYANLLATLDNDCDASIETFERSLDIDPYYANTYFALAGVYELCAERQPQEERVVYYEKAAATLETALEREVESDGAILVQAAQLYQQAGQYEDAINALQQVRRLDDSQVPAWNVDFRLANIYYDMGDLERAEALATEALAAAPVEAQAQIQAFVDQLEP